MKEKLFEDYGFKNISYVYRNIPTPALYEAIVKRNEGLIAHLGPIVVRTGHHTGRSANDKFIVKNSASKDVFWSKDNKPISEEAFERIFSKIRAYLQTKEIFVQDCYAGSDES